MNLSCSLTEGSIAHNLLRFALPMLYANALQVFNGSVNSLWVGRYLGEAALTATLNANMVIFLVIGMVFGIASGCTILVGKYVGANSTSEAKSVVGTGTSFFSVVSVIMTVAGLTLCKPLLILMSTPADSILLAVAYMRVMCIALPCMFMYSFVISILRGAGDSKTPLHFMVLSVTLDVVLNPVLIFGFGPVPALGIVGSGVATLVSQGIGLAALIYSLYLRHHPLCFQRSDVGLLRIDWAILSQLVRTGMPMSVEMFVLSLGIVLMTSLVNRFGVNTAAAFGAAMQLWSYVQMPGLAVSMAATSMAAHNVGARKWERLAVIAKVGVLYAVLLTGVLVWIVEVFNSQAFGLFLPQGSEALKIGGHLNRISTWSFMFVGVFWVLSGVARAAGAVMAPLVVLTVSVLLVRFPIAEALLDRYQTDAIWWSFSISAVVAAALAGFHYKYGSWRVERILPTGDPMTVPSKKGS